MIQHTQTVSSARIGIKCFVKGRLKEGSFSRAYKDVLAACRITKYLVAIKEQCELVSDQSPQISKVSFNLSRIATKYNTILTLF